MRAPLLVAVAALLVGCGSTTAPATASRPTATGPDQTSVDADFSTNTSVPRFNDVGVTVANGGIAATVKAVREAEAVDLNKTGSPPGSGSERYTTTPAADGAKYVVVTARVANNGRSAITMTCRVPIRTAVVDDQQHSFDPIDDLDELRGNPECHNKLQPGAVHDVTWAYLVPYEARITGWTFQDVTDPHTQHDRTTVRLSVS